MMGLYDEYYIPDKSSYNKFHFDHDYIIYGADTENKQFLSAGYLKNGFYQPYKINFNHFIKSIIVSDGRIHMWPIKFNNSIDLDINLALIKESLYKYIFSQPNSRMESDFFGICACHALLNHCIDTINHKLNLDIRSIYAFAEHKKFMLARFKYLKENIHISINDNILAFLEYIYENSQIVLKLSMRFNLVFDATIGERIINYIQDSISMEEKILPDLLTCF